MSSEGSAVGTQTQEGFPLLHALFLGLMARQDRNITHAIAFLNPATGTLSIVHGPDNLDALFQAKAGPLPASKASIAAMPRPTVTEEDRGKDCAICLEELELGCEVREMPCKHWFHSGCIEKWLEMNGSCPVCRFAMPVEEQGDADKSGAGVGEEGERRGENQMAVLLTLVIGGAERVAPAPETSREATGHTDGAGNGESDG